ncbi:MAG TPA: DUF4339 domain-containing protein [Pirellulales bacterium]|nr:DUF4339 domain-containing protein [Pirellulales bacterium]
MSNDWFYMKGADKHGPVSSQRLKELAQSGQLLPTDLVWREDMGDWKRARKIDGLFDGKPVGRPTRSSSTTSTPKKRPPTPPGNLMGLTPTVRRSRPGGYRAPANSSTTTASPPPVAGAADADGIFRCPHCGQGISNDPTMAGDLVGCPHCAKRFQMPNAASKASASAGISISVASPRRSPAFWLWAVPGLLPLFGSKNSAYATVGVAVLLCVALLVLSVNNPLGPPAAKSPEAPVEAPNKEPVKTREMQPAELLLLVFLGSLFLALLALCVSVPAIATSCPKCEQTFARRRTAQRYLGSRHGMSVRTRVDEYYGRNGPGLFQTPTGYGTRAEQVAVERSFHKDYWKCRYCDHAWDTVTVTESEVW